jgi:hypothetical protein
MVYSRGRVWQAGAASRATALQRGGARAVFAATIAPRPPPFKRVPALALGALHAELVARRPRS